MSAEELDPTCNDSILPSGATHSDRCCHDADAGEDVFLNLHNPATTGEHKLYPTNTFDAPLHVPGHRFPPPTAGTPVQAVQAPDYSEYDVVKAAQYGYLERVKQLIEEEGIDVNEPDAENVCVLHWAAINNRLPVVEYALSCGAVVDTKGGTLMGTPLHWSVRQGHLQMTILLMRHGADPALEDLEGCSCIHLAAQFGHTSIVAYLISKGMDVDLVDRNGMTPLMWSSYRSFGVDPTRLILNFGASVNFSDTVHKNTALHWAISSCNTNAIKPLLNVGASLDVLNLEGHSVFNLAVERKNNYILHQLQLARSEQGVGRPGFIKKLVTDKSARRSFIISGAFIPLFSIGLILEYSTWWLYTMIALAVVCYGTIATISVLGKPQNNPGPLGLYFATKAYMFTTLLFYFWPFITTNNLIAFSFNTFALFYFFWKSWMLDPGFIRVSQTQQKRNIIDMAEQGMLQDFSKFCTTCLIRRPIRSKHCQICDRCVARMDHHCPWVENCVGVNNHVQFVSFLFFLLGMNAWFIWASILYYHHICGPFMGGVLLNVLHAGSCAPWVSFGFTMACLHTLWVGALLSSQLYQTIWLGMTTNERMNSGRYKHFHNKETGTIVSPFGSGVLQNIANFFNISFCGLMKPQRIDWMNEFAIPNFTGPQTNWRSFNV